MSILGHTVISLTAGCVMYNFHRSLACFLWFFIAGVFIDMDHYLDYYVYKRRISFALKKVHNTIKYGYMQFKKSFLILHSYELIMLFWVLIFLLDMDIVWKYAAMGLTLHIFIDQLVNPTILPFTYFLWFRIVNNFETNKLFVTKNS